MATRGAKLLGYSIMAIAIAAPIYGCVTRKPPAADAPDPDVAVGDFPNDAASIRNAGFNCPAVFRKSRQPPDAYGKVQRVFCALDKDNYVSFRATLRPNGEWLIAPW